MCDVYVQALGDHLEEKGEDPEKFFFETMFKGCWDSEGTDGDRREEEFFDSFDKDPKETSSFALLHAVLIAVSYAVQAMKTMKAEKASDLAWSYAASAQYWAGIVRGTPFGKAATSNAASEMAKKRHAENYALAETALEYWKNNIDPALSAQKAATELSKVVPLSHKKLAEIVSAAKKGDGAF